MRQPGRRTGIRDAGQLPCQRDDRLCLRYINDLREPLSAVPMAVRTVTGKLRSGARMAAHVNGLLVQLSVALDTTLAALPAEVTDSLIVGDTLQTTAIALDDLSDTLVALTALDAAATEDALLVTVDNLLSQVLTETGRRRERRRWHRCPCPPSGRDCPASRGTDRSVRAVRSPK